MLQSFHLRGCTKKERLVILILLCSEEQIKWVEYNGRRLMKI